jgi:hypothetical protein
MMQIQIVVGGEIGDVAAEVPEELLFRSEGQPAYVGMHAVRADH